MTDVELDGRVTVLEETIGGSGQNGNTYYISYSILHVWIFDVGFGQWKSCCKNVLTI